MAPQLANTQASCSKQAAQATPKGLAPPALCRCCRKCKSTGIFRWAVITVQRGCLNRDEKSLIFRPGFCAVGETRTRTGLLPLPPQSSVSTISPPPLLSLGLQRYDKKSILQIFLRIFFEIIVIATHFYMHHHHFLICQDWLYHNLRTDMLAQPRNFNIYCIHATITDTRKSTKGVGN